jgi:hypothetical protein
MPRKTSDELPVLDEHGDPISDEMELPDPLGQSIPVPKELLELEFQEARARTIRPTAALQEQEFLSELGYREFADDFLMLNDITLSDVPMNAIQIESHNDVFVAETLRSESPVVATKGLQDMVLTITLVFPEGPAQSVKLHRLIAELTHNPLVYVFNGKVRKSLGVSSPAINTIFVLETGTLSNSATPGQLILTLTLHHFNFKPFSNHFWYNTTFPNVSKRRPTPERELLLGDLTSYEASAHSLDYEAEKMVNDIREGLLPLRGEEPNVPVNFPGASDAWMYYADHMQKNTPGVGTTNSDIVGFTLQMLEHHNPPDKTQKLGRGVVADVLKEQDGFPSAAAIYNATNAPLVETDSQGQITTATQQAAKQASVPGQEVPVFLKRSKRSWQSAREELWKWDREPWRKRGKLELGKQLSPHLADKETGETVHYEHKEKCNIMFYETLHRAGYQVPIQARAKGKGFGYFGCRQTVRAAQHNARWLLRLTGQSAKNIQKVIDAGIPVGIVWSKHVMLLTRVHHIGYAADKTIISIYCQAVDQKSKRAGPPKTRLASNTKSGIEIFQALPIGVRPKLAKRTQHMDVSKGPNEKKPEQTKQQEQKKPRPQPTEGTAAKSEAIPGKPTELPKDVRSQQARNKWIASYNAKGWYYYSEDPKLRNIFAKDVQLYVSSNPDDYRDSVFAKNMVLSGLSVTFGHRIVPIKLLSQDTYTWQFLGAGNKTGTLSFTFTGVEGREGADALKKMIFRARENARRFNAMIPYAGSMRVESSHPVTDETNNILALLSIRDIVVTDVQESSVEGSVDQHQMNVSFITQDFAEERLDRYIPTDISAKRQIVSGIMKFLKSEKPKKLSNDPQDDDRRNIIPKPSIIEPRLYEVAHENQVKQEQGYWVAGHGRPWKVKDPYFPGWLAEAVIQAADICQKTQNEMPPVVWKTAPDSNETWETAYRTWGAEGVLFGQVKNIPNEDKPSTAIVKKGPAAQAEMMAELDSPRSHYTRVKHDRVGTWNDMYNGKFSTNGAWATNREHARVFNKWLNSMERVIRQVQSHVLDERFDNYFPGIRQQRLEATALAVGECYADMNLPEVPLVSEGTDSQQRLPAIPLPPEFYIYDDSKEDSVVSALTDVNNMETFLRRHVRNEVASIQRYLHDTMLGGSYLSYNLPRILESRKIYLEKFAGVDRAAGEITFLDYEQMMQEGTNAWEPVYYRPDDPDYQAKGPAAWFKTVSTGLKATDYTTAQFNFMQNLTHMSEYVQSGRPLEWHSSDVMPEPEKLIEAMYDVNWRALSFGPNPDYKTADKKLSGTPDSQQTQKSKEEIKRAGGFVEWGDLGPRATRLSDGSYTVGNNKEEVQAAADAQPSAWGVVKDQYFALLGGVTRLAGKLGINPLAMAVEAIGDVQKLVDQKAENRANLIRAGGITEILKGLDHDVAKGKFGEGSKVKNTAALGTSIALGNKKNDLSMRRAFPTFKIYFIEDDADEDIKVNGRVVRAFDDFYSYSCVQEIRIIRSRKVAADLAIIRITNIGDTLLRRRWGEKAQYIKDHEAKYGINAERATGIFADTELENPFENMILQDGVKVQIRLGYAANPDLLESVFLGSIVEIAPSEDGKILEIVCQGYGAELEGVELGPLSDGKVFYSSQEVLSGAILHPSIVHFGRRSDYNRFLTSEIRHKLRGGHGQSILYQLNPASLITEWGRRETLSQLFKNPHRNEPQDDNIFAPPPKVYATTWMKYWDNACAYRPIKQTPWEIFREHELRHPGYAALAIPYGHSPRMTMFFGAKGQHYWSRPPSDMEMLLADSATRGIRHLKGLEVSKLIPNEEFRSSMRKLAAANPKMANAIAIALTSSAPAHSVETQVSALFGRYKPFRNYHYFDSVHHILKNTIRTNRNGVPNEVEVLYFDNDNLLEEEDAEDLVDNLQALQRSDSGVLACKLDENIPDEYLRSYREEFPSCITVDMAKRYVQGLFARHLRDAYQGELIVTGNEKLKPYDVCLINDSSINMIGPIEVEAVEQVFNRDFGFISIITPDMCVVVNDFYAQAAIDTACEALSYAYGFDQPQSGVSLTALTSPLPLMAMTAAVKIINWTQDAVPVITNPLTLGGKPFVSVACGAGRSSLFVGLHGRWYQYWDDLETAWDKLDIGEELFGAALDISESFWGFLGDTGGLEEAEL